MRNVEMCEDLPTPDADAVEVVVRALARARSGVAADKAIALYERHFGTRGDLGAPSEACVQAVLLACARKAPPPKGLFDLKRSVRDDVKAAREVLDGLEGGFHLIRCATCASTRARRSPSARRRHVARRAASGPEGGGRSPSRPRIELILQPGRDPWIRGSSI